MAQQYASTIVRAFRAARLALHVLYGAVVAALILHRVSEKHQHFLISRWAKQLLQILNIRIITRGILPDRDVMGTLFVGNHISWLDIHALNSLRAVRFVAKSEIRGWPVFGWLASQTNTLFIERERKTDAARIVETIADSLKQGDSLCYFPEGTTTDGTEIKPFKRSLIQAAIDANVPVWPFSISYPKADGSANKEMAYYGEMSLLDSLRLVLRQKSATVVLDFSLPINPKGYDRRDIAILAQQAIASRLRLPAR